MNMATTNIFSDSISANIAVGIALIFVYPIGQAIYNVFFHPLSKFPGPKLWAASRLPYVRAMLKGTLVKEELRIHKKYGEIVRIGPDEVSFASEAAWDDIYLLRKGHPEVMKNKLWYAAPNDAPQNIITTGDPEVHTRMRKLLANSFSESNVRAQTPIIESYADLFITRLRSMATASETNGNGTVINITDWITFFTTDIIGDLSFGESFHCLRDSRYHPWVSSLYNFLKGMNLATAPKFYPLVDFVFTKMIPKSILEAVKTHTEFVNKSIEKRMSWDTSRPDFMTPMLKDNVNFENMTLGEIQSNFAIIIVAGSETTATTLCGILNYITRSEYSSVFEKVVREARKKFKQEKDITVESTKDLTYLHAVLNEGLRLCNPVPGGLMRTSAPGGDVYSGVFVPGNTTMAVRPYVMNRSPSLFARPSEFVPERWLSDSERPKEFAGDRLNSSRPFSTGHHACLGKPLAWVEMRLLLTRFLWAFDICQEEGKVLDWDDQQMIIMIHKEPFYLRIKAR